MKPAVAIQLLAPRLVPDQLLLLHVRSKDGHIGPFYLVNFDAGLAHGYHIVNHDEVIRVVECWADIDNWVEFCADRLITLEDVQKRVDEMNKEQKNTPSVFDMIQQQVFTASGGVVS